MADAVDGGIFKAPLRKSAVDTVLETFRDLILSGQLKRGDRLPNELELTRQLSTSRGSIREAMKILSSFGIVEIRRGNGTFVSSSMSNRLFDHLVFQMILSDADKQKLVELRVLLEVGIIKFVLANATDEDIRLIKQEYDRMAESVEKQVSDPTVMTELDLAFHHAIGRATKNELIRKIYEVTLDLFTPSIKETHMRPDNSRNALKHHENILAGLIARDRERAEAAAEESIKSWAERST